jgi:hypothetical protein
VPGQQGLTAATRSALTQSFVISARIESGPLSLGFKTNTVYAPPHNPSENISHPCVLFHLVTLGTLDGDYKYN